MQQGLTELWSSLTFGQIRKTKAYKDLPESTKKLLKPDIIKELVKLGKFPTVEEIRNNGFSLEILALEMAEIKKKSGGDEEVLNKLMDEHLDEILISKWDELRTLDIKKTQAYKNLSRKLEKSKLSRYELIRELVRNSKFPPPDPSAFEERQLF
jgi:hypothetical protein